jgi:hypothetical protein
LQKIIFIKKDVTCKISLSTIKRNKGIKIIHNGLYLVHDPHGPAGKTRSGRENGHHKGHVGSGLVIGHQQKVLIQIPDQVNGLRSSINHIIPVHGETIQNVSKQFDTAPQSIRTGITITRFFCCFLNVKVGEFQRNASINKSDLATIMAVQEKYRYRYWFQERWQLLKTNGSRMTQIPVLRQIQPLIG